MLSLNDIMAASPSSRQITLRVPASLYEQIQEIARLRRTSVNKLAQEELERLTHSELGARLDAAYALLADDDDTDVEPFFAAQREILEPVGEESQ